MVEGASRGMRVEQMCAWHSCEHARDGQTLAQWASVHDAGSHARKVHGRSQECTVLFKSTGDHSEIRSLLSAIGKGRVA